jgi:hypothetical protein
VGDTLSLLWAARRGLTETEMLDALGKPTAQGEHEPLPRAKWSPMFLAMSDALISRGGLLTFAHDFLRTAVENAYLPNEQNQKRAYLRLADYFERQPASSRRTDELPWQLAEAKEWQRLQKQLIDRVFFKEAWSRNQYNVKNYWTRIESGSNLRMVEAYRPLIETPEKEPDNHYLNDLYHLFADTGHPDEAKKLAEPGLAKLFPPGIVNDNAKFVHDFVACGKLHSSSTNPNEKKRVLDKMRLMGVTNRFTGHPDLAYKWFEALGNYYQQVDDANGRQEMLGQQAEILFSQHNLDGAMRLHKERELICRKLGNLSALQDTLTRQVVVLSERKDVVRELELNKEREQICRMLGNLNGLVYVLNSQAVVLGEFGDLHGGMALLKEEERICRDVGNVEWLASCLSLQGVFLWRMNRADEGIPLVEEAQKLAVRSGDTARAKKIETVLNTIRLVAQNKVITSTVSSTQVNLSTLPQCELTVPQLRDSAVTALKRGLWEAAETCLEKLLQQGEPVETVAPDLITALLNAHKTPTSAAVTRIETLLAKLASAGHNTLSKELRSKFSSKLEASKPKKPKWKLW